MVEIVNNEKEEPKNIQLIITLFPSGEVNVSGAVNNLLLAYGLLETAKDCVKKHIEQSNSRIIKGNGQHNIMNFIRQKK